MLYCLYKGSLKHISRGSYSRSRALSATSERKPLYFTIINLQLFSILLSCFIIWPFPAFLLEPRQWLSISFTSGTDNYCKNITYIDSFSKGDICSTKGVLLLCHFSGYTPLKSQDCFWHLWPKKNTILCYRKQYSRITQQCCIFKIIILFSILSTYNLCWRSSTLW